MASKPSHLEAVDPVVMGLVKVLWQRLSLSEQQHVGRDSDFHRGQPQPEPRVSVWCRAHKHTTQRCP